MANPTVKISIAFGNDPWDASPTWTDVSADYIAHNIHRGRQHDLDRFEPGTAQILLLNTSGDYWPHNSGGPYYGDVDIKKRVKIEAVYNGTTYARFVGYIEKWAPSWFSDKGGIAPVMTLECADALSHIARYVINTSYSQENSGTRIGNVLNSVGFPAADRTIDTGKISVIASTLTNGNGQDHLNKVQETELGLVYIGDDGKANFENRSHRTTSPHNTSQHTFTDAFADIELALDDPLLYNDVRLTRTGGSEQTAGDSASQTAYGKHSLVRSGLLHTSDVITGIYTQYLLSRYKQPAMRAKSLTLHPAVSPDTLFPIALDYEISTRITVEVSQADLSADYFIEGIDESFNTRTQLWETKYQISDAAQYLFTPAAVTETIRPNGGGTYSQWFSGANANNVNDQSDATYDFNDNVGTYKNTYAMGNLSGSPTSISNVRVYMRNKADASPTSGWIKTYLISGATEAAGAETDSASIANYYTDYATDPNTGVAWTESAVNALEAGAQHNKSSANGYLYEVWAEVTYVPAW